MDYNADMYVHWQEPYFESVDKQHDKLQVGWYRQERERERERK
jgi:hypothetical protein